MWPDRKAIFRYSPSRCFSYFPTGYARFAQQTRAEDGLKKVRWRRLAVGREAGRATILKYLFYILPALDESLSRVIPEPGDGRATFGYLTRDHSDLIAGLETIAREAKVDHV
jgi:hypothetical protein